MEGDQLHWLHGDIFTEEALIFTEEALKAQDGKKVPLTMDNGSEVIGEATMRYDPGQKALVAEFTVEDPKVAELLSGAPPIIFKKED